MRRDRFSVVRVAGLLGAAALVALAVVGAEVAAPATASAQGVTENFAADMSGVGYVPLQLTPDISQPSTVAAGGTYTMTVAPSTFVVPNFIGGQQINHITNLQFMFPVPTGATYLKGLANNLTWSATDGSHGGYTARLCGPGDGNGTTCSGSSTSSTFLGDTTIPYIQVCTGGNGVLAGATISLPGWSAIFTVTGATGSFIDQTQSEAATTATLHGGGQDNLDWYPSVFFSGTPSTPPPYQFQPLASTSIGVPAATVSAVLPNSGQVSGGTTVVIHGTNLSNPTGVRFGSTPALSFVGETDDAVEAISPPSPIPTTVDVFVSTSNGESDPNPPGDQFTYTRAPVVTGVSPHTGPPSGGTQVTITGAQFTPGATVQFQGTPASNVVVQSSTTITATSPAQGANPQIVNVTVSNAQGTSSQSVLDHFSYIEGYWFVASDGGVFAFPGATTPGAPPFYGSMGGQPLNKPVVSMASTPDGGGYWLVASDGGIFSFGDAQFYGSTGGQPLNAPIVGMASTPDGLGYWLVASDGGIFSYGDAQFYGSMGGKHLNEPIVGMASTPDGGGYWLVASDGGIFAYGDAGFYGSTGAIHLNKPVVGMTPTANGGGYWFDASDGGIFAYGNAAFYGSMGGQPLNQPAVGMAATPDGSGYWLVAADGGIFSFPTGAGGAPFYGSTGGIHLNKPVVGIAVPGG